MRAYFYSLMTDQRNDLFSFLLKQVLSLFAFFYQLFLKLWELLWRSGFFKSKKVSLPVISVGNITVGGTGKTPFVKWLVTQLASRGKRAAVLTRGYQKLSKDLSDEALELREAFPDVPVLIGRDRVSLAKRASSGKVDALILDDGFQHRRMRRDVDIVLIDATNPFGNGRLLPRGILREGLSSLWRADFLVLTRTEDGSEKQNGLKSLLKKHAPNIPILFSTQRLIGFYEAKAEKKVPLETLRNERLIGFCGIGNPGAFQRLLEQNGISLLKMVSFMDHHPYRRRDVEALDRAAASLQAGALLTTKKDVERLHALKVWPSTRLIVSEVELKMTQNENELFRRLDTLLSR